MKGTKFFLFSILLVTACVPTNQVSMTEMPTHAPTISTIQATVTRPLQTPQSDDISSTRTQQPAAPTEASPLQTVAAQPAFGPAISGGGPNTLYPAQDIALIGQTGQIQFLNIYANW